MEYGWERYLVNKGKVPFKYREVSKSLKTYTSVSTQEFNENGEIEAMPWIYYCFMTCDNRKPVLDEPEYYVMRSRSGGNIHFTIIEKLKEEGNDNAATMD
jgi:hypothetical protein